MLYGQRIARRRDIMNTQDGRAALGGQDGRRHGTMDAIDRGFAVGQRADHAFARQAGEQRHAQICKAIQPRQQRQVVFERLAETETRIDHQSLPVDSRHVAGKQPACKKPVNVGQHVVVMRCVLHAPGLALHVHEADRHRQFGGDLERLVALQRAHVVDKTRTGCNRRAHDVGLARINRDRHRCPFRQCLDHRQDASPLFIRRDRCGAWTRGLSADIEQVGGYPEYSGEPYADADADGMPDEWETANGLNPRDASDAAGDLNGDGYTHIEDFLYGLDPQTLYAPWSAPRTYEDLFWKF